MSGRMATLYITDDGEIRSGGRTICTVEPGHQTSLELWGGAYAILIHREPQPGSRAKMRPSRPLAKIRKLPKVQP